MPVDFRDHVLSISERFAEKVFVTQLHSGRPPTTLSYAELLAAAEAVASGLQATHTKAKHVVLVDDNTIDFIISVFGVILSGKALVPVVYTSGRRYDAKRYQSIFKIVEASVVICSEGTLADQLRQDFEHLSVEDVNSLSCCREKSARKEGSLIDQPMVIQFTSGSTADPKGVVISHKNVMSNELAIEAAFQHTSKTVVVGWLPHHHDMGLFGNLLQSFFVGGSYVYMSPAMFLKRPIRWLEAIDQFKATTSGGPDFAYDLCSNRISTRHASNLNLSSWRVAFNGSDRVVPETLERFSAVFQASRFNSNAFLPCYGLAEATLLVSCTKPQVPWRSWLPGSFGDHTQNDEPSNLVLCGKPATGVELFIRDPNSQSPCDEGSIGEICVSGPSVSSGYLSASDVTEDVRFDYLGKKWFPTGDLGYISTEGLYPIGRISDVVNIGGRKIHLKDIEQGITSALNHFSYKGEICAVSFGATVPNAIGVVIEMQSRDARNSAMRRHIREVVNQISMEFGIAIGPVYLANRREIPKTTSGKLRRNMCARLCTQGRFEHMASNR